MQVAAHTLTASRELLDVAEEFRRAAQGRYYGGAGSLIDVLNAQSSLAEARMRQIVAEEDLRTARMTLLSSVGRLGLNNLNIPLLQ